jgi:cofilin
MRYGLLTQFLILAISNDAKEIFVESFLDRKKADSIGVEATYDAMVQRLPSDAGRYVIFDLEYTLGSDGVRNKLVFIAWNPELGAVRSRMLYAASKGALKLKLDGLSQEVQATVIL